MSLTPHTFAEFFGSSGPRGVVFDCDGILLDTQALWDRSIAQLLADRGVTLDPAESAALVGRTVEHVVVAVATAVNEDPHAVGSELGSRYKALMGGEIPVLPGVMELVEAVSRKVPVAVASNTPRSYLVENLRAAGILPFLDHVVGADDVGHGKPAPDMYLRACDLLGVEPREALAFEDSDTGARAASSAGLPLIAAPIIPGQSPEADLTIDAIGNSSLLAWVSTWAPSRKTSAMPDAPTPFSDLRHVYPAGVVFDCDGLILDTESVWEDVQQGILARYNATPTPEQEQALMGTTLEQAVEILAGITGEDYEALLGTTRDEFTAAIEGELRFMPGAKQFVELVASKVPIAVASNSWHSALESKLTRAGIIDLFENLQSSDTVENVKPAPDMYAKAARDMGLDPAECVAFEDSPLGGRAAKSAGMTLIGVPSTASPVESADVQVANLEDPELLAWVSSWPNRK